MPALAVLLAEQRQELALGIHDQRQLAFGTAQGREQALLPALDPVQREQGSTLAVLTEEKELHLMEVRERLLAGDLSPPT